jgi:hypothetical protein
MSEINSPQKPEPHPAPSIAPPMAPVAPMKTRIVALKADYPTWEVSAVQPVPASSSGGRGPSHPLDSIAESSPDKLLRKELGT